MYYTNIRNVHIIFVARYGFFSADHKAFWHKQHGSWFIEEFILMCELYSHVDHLLDIIMKVGEMAFSEMYFA